MPKQTRFANTIIKCIYIDKETLQLKKLDIAEINLTSNKSQILRQLFYFDCRYYLHYVRHYVLHKKFEYFYRDHFSNLK